MSDPKKLEFQSRNETKELVLLPRDTVLAAMSFGPRLSNILREAVRHHDGETVPQKSFDSYPKEWVRLVRKHEPNTDMALGALAFRALMEERRGRVRPGDLKESLRETESQEGRTALDAGIEIVGESFYGASFNAIRRQTSTSGAFEKVLHGQLRNEPDNPHSLSGKAVQVFAKGKKVGYLPERLAPGVFGLLEPDGGEMNVLLRVWLDDERNNPQRNSVRVLGRAETTGITGKTDILHSDSRNSDGLVVLRYHSVVEPVFSQPLMGVNSSVGERRIFIASERKNSLVHMYRIEHPE